MKELHNILTEFHLTTAESYTLPPMPFGNFTHTENLQRSIHHSETLTTVQSIVSRLHLHARKNLSTFFNIFYIS
jgi:hypothetical protein